jgi:hypothetical protein
MEIEYWEPRNEQVTTDRGFVYLDTKSVLKSSSNWEGSPEEIYKRFDKENNSLRYCNGSYYKFKNDDDHSNYIKWYQSLNKMEQFNMFYGNGIVD